MSTDLSQSELEDQAPPLVTAQKANSGTGMHALASLKSSV
jgi:hypothetical protein